MIQKNQNGFTPTPIGALFCDAYVWVYRLSKRLYLAGGTLLRERQNQELCANRCRGFTLIETMVAITVLTIAIVAPMALTTRSLASAYYARDQIAAFHLAQEAIEAVRSVRDGNILRNALGTPVNLLNGIPSVEGAPFTIDTRDNSMTLCGGTCPVLKTNGSLYGYGIGSDWVSTRFTRTVTAVFVTGTDEVRISVAIKWQTGTFQERTFTISENLYRWVEDGSGV